MCAHCEQSDYPDVELVVRGVTADNAVEKFEKAVAVLGEQLGIDALVKAEGRAGGQVEQPIPVVQGIIDKYTKKLQRRVRATIKGVLKWYGKAEKADGDGELFTIMGVPQWNAATGTWMTKRQWKLINDQINRFLGDYATALGYQMASEAAIAGILAGVLESKTWDMAAQSYNGVQDKLDDDLDNWLKGKNMAPGDYRVSRLNTERTAMYCTDMADDVRKGIKATLLQATAEGWHSSKLEQDLFDRYGDLNKDWRRIALTETADAYSDGYIEHEAADADEGEDVFFIGRGDPNACAICKRDVIGKVVKLVSKPQGSDESDDPRADAVIWPGKTSVGHGARESWATVSRHPHCACRWVRYFPE